MADRETFARAIGPAIRPIQAIMKTLLPNAIKPDPGNPRT